jgi:hypothetical protein
MHCVGAEQDKIRSSRFKAAGCLNQNVSCFFPLTVSLINLNFLKIYTCAPPVLKNAGCPPASRQTLITLFSFLTRFDGDDKPDAWRDQLCNHPQSLQLTWVPALLRLPVCQTEDY